MQRTTPKPLHYLPPCCHAPLTLAPLLARLQMDWDEATETRSRRSRADTLARTARTGEWDEDVFSGMWAVGHVRMGRPPSGKSERGWRGDCASRSLPLVRELAL